MLMFSQSQVKDLYRYKHTFYSIYIPRHSGYYMCITPHTQIIFGDSGKPILGGEDISPEFIRAIRKTAADKILGMKTIEELKMYDYI